MAKKSKIWYRCNLQIVVREFQLWFQFWVKAEVLTWRLDFSINFKGVKNQKQFVICIEFLKKKDSIEKTSLKIPGSWSKIWIIYEKFGKTQRRQMWGVNVLKNYYGPDHLLLLNLCFLSLKKSLGLSKLSRGFHYFCNLFREQMICLQKFLLLPLWNILVKIICFRTYVQN